MLITELIGTLGADAETKEVNKEEYTTFSVATTPDYRKKDETVWVQIMLKGTTIAQYLTKGTRVFIRGRLRVSAWANKQGEPQAGLSVFSSEIQLLGGSEKKDDAPSKIDTKKPKRDLPF